MDLSPLNQAHREYRRAEILKQKRLYLDSVECHQKVLKLLESILPIVTNTITKESILLQLQYHKRQIELLIFFRQESLKHRYQDYEYTMNEGLNLNKNAQNENCIIPEEIYQVFDKLQKNLDKFDRIYQTFDNERAHRNANLLVSGTQNCGNLSNDGDIGEVVDKGAIDQLSDLSFVEELRVVKTEEHYLFSKLMIEIEKIVKENLYLKKECPILNPMLRLQSGMIKESKIKKQFSTSIIEQIQAVERLEVKLNEYEHDKDAFEPSFLSDLAPLEMPPLDFIEKMTEQH